jgi:hypothetical protein
MLQEIWSRERELNSRPADYESAALPLSYLGLSITYRLPRSNLRSFGIISLAPLACRALVSFLPQESPHDNPSSQKHHYASKLLVINFGFTPNPYKFEANELLKLCQPFHFGTDSSNTNASGLMCSCFAA